MKTKEELSVIKEEVEAMSKKLAELDTEELKLVTGGAVRPGNMPPGTKAMCYCGTCDTYFTNMFAYFEHMSTVHGKDSQ